jgi:hypothetical protein
MRLAEQLFVAVPPSHPTVDSVRGDPRYERLLEQMKLP